ncbi:MAG TPA: hypothetical protein VKA09_07580 [Nitrososphaeraceae archaeon]|nr:hypothetical protein [Nitrososphaeraceae archaeon]
MKARAPRAGLSESHMDKNRQFFICLSVLVFLLQVSSFMYFFLLYDVFVIQLSSLSGGILFVVLTVSSYGVGYYLLARYSKQINIQGQKSDIPYLRSMFHAVRIIFFITAAILAIIILQILITSQYYVGLSLAIVLAGYLLAAVNAGLLGYKMLSWYRMKHNLATLLFGITFVTAAIGFSNIAIVNSAFFFSVNPYLTEQYYVEYGYPPDHNDGDPVPHFFLIKSDSLFALYQLTMNILRAPYFLMWASAIVLVRNYSKTMGIGKFLLITVLPGLIYPITIFESVSGGVFPSLFASLYGGSSLALAGLFVAIIFFVSAKNMKGIHASQNNAISQYLIITGFGFLLALVASSPAAHVIDRIHTPFPPFATLTWAFLGFSAYLVSTGFYLSAIRISQDIGLRKSIRQVATEESSSRLLDNIGTAQMEQAIQDRVQKIAKEQEESLKKETGVRQEVSQEDVESYVKEVLEEVKKIRRK